MKQKNIIEITDLTFAYPGEERNVFSGLNLKIPSGMITLVGQNGAGKSTLMLLAGGRLHPTAGRILLNNQDTSRLTDEETRNKAASFVYQNMEFETEEPIGELLEYVYQNGFSESKPAGLVEELTEAFNLKKSLNKPFQNLSKGDMQKTVIAFSMLYGSKVIFMDEPVFALEDQQKHEILNYVRNFQKTHDLTIIYSAHELELSQQYSDHAILFHKGGKIENGSTENILTAEKLEEAYGIPFAMLNQKERLFREHLLDLEKYGPEITEDLRKGDILN